MYGYELAKLVREKSEEQFELKEGTLYRSVKRLEKNEWVESYWGDEQGPGGRRKYYKLTPLGKESYEEKKTAQNEQNTESQNSLVKKEKFENGTE